MMLLKTCLAALRRAKKGLSSSWRPGDGGKKINWIMQTGLCRPVAEGGGGRGVGQGFIETPNLMGGVDLAAEHG